MSERHYDYSCHTEIPNHMRAYLMDVVDQEYLEAVDIEDINSLIPAGRVLASSSGGRG